MDLPLKVSNRRSKIIRMKLMSVVSWLAIGNLGFTSIGKETLKMFIRA